MLLNPGGRFKTIPVGTNGAEQLSFHVVSFFLLHLFIFHITAILVMLKPFPPIHNEQSPAATNFFQDTSLDCWCQSTELETNGFRL